MVENPAQPEEFSSIPAAMWWGVGIFALPAGILASGFADELDKQRVRRTEVCPHCGQVLEQP